MSRMMIGPTHAVGHGSDRDPARQDREATPEELATQAKNLGDNLGRWQQLANDGVHAMIHTEAAGDRAGWQAGKKKVDGALASIKDAIPLAAKALGNASDEVTKQRLGAVQELHDTMAARLGEAPAAPEVRAPTISCEGALLAALPPDGPVANAHQVYGDAERAVAAVFGGAMIFSDMAAFASLLRDHPDHEIARRFRRLGPERQARLRAILADGKVRARANALEQAQQRAATMPPLPAGFVVRQVAAPSAPVTIDAPPTRDETRATIDDAPDTDSASEAAPASPGADTPATIDAPAEYDESSATIDDSADGRAERNARREARERGADGVPGTIDAPPEYEERDQTIDDGVEPERPASGSKKRGAKKKPQEKVDAPAGAEAVVDAKTPATEPESEVTISRGDAILRDPTGGALRSHISTGLGVMAKKAESLPTLAEHFTTAVGDLEIEGVITFGMKLLDAYATVDNGLPFLADDLDVAEVAGSDPSLPDDPARAAEVAALRDRHREVSATLLASQMAIAVPVQATTFRGQRVPGVAAKAPAGFDSDTFGGFLRQEVARTTMLVATLDDLRIRVAMLAGADPPRDVVDLVEAWQGDRTSFLFLHHALGELGLTALLDVETRNGKSLDERAAQVSRGVPQLAEDIPATIEAAKDAHDSGDRAGASTMVGLAIERMRELGSESAVREIVAHGGGGGWAFGLQMEVLQLAESYALAARDDLAGSQSAKGNLVLAIKATRTAVPVYQIVSGEADYAASGFVSADDFATLSGATGLAMMLAAAAPKLIPALVAGAAAAFQEMAIAAARNPELALEVVMFAASIGLTIGEDGVDGFLQSLETPEGLIAMVGDILALRMAAGPVGAPDASPQPKRQRADTPSGEGDLGARLADVVDKIRAFGEAAVESFSPQRKRAGASAGGPDVQVDDGSSSFGENYKTHLQERRAARVDAGGVSYFPTPGQRRAGYHPPQPGRSTPQLAKQLAAEARAETPHKDATTDAERAAAFQKQVDYFDHVEAQARQEKFRIEQQKAKANSAELEQELQERIEAAETLEQAAKIKPVAGSLPQNYEKAGGEFTVEDIIKKKVDSNPDLGESAIKELEKRGLDAVQFTEAGHPDLAPFIYREGDVVGEVTIELSGTRRTDFSRADEKMREQNPKWRQPRGWTWHHHEQEGRMILVPTSIHSVIAHTGGAAKYRHRTGDITAYSDEE